MKSATDSPCRFSALKARIFGCAKNKALWGVVAVVITCLGVAVFAPMAEVRADEGTIVCERIPYTGERPTSGTVETKKLSICAEVSSDGVIKSRLKAVSNTLKEINVDPKIIDTITDVEKDDKDENKRALNYQTLQIGSGFLSPKSTESSSTKYTIGETKLDDFVSDIKENLVESIEDDNGIKWESQEIEIVGDATAVSDIVKNNDILENDTNKECNKATGLGWFLCPAIDILKDATTGLYDGVIEQFLQINPGIFSDNNSAVYQAWQLFQNFANIGLVIIIIFIVFSQLTGFGIDNYGIKKSLPKLIVAVVLINLSYFIAQLCVDLANILGYSLRALFDGLAAQVDLTTNGANAGYGTAMAAGATASTAVVAGAVAIITTFSSWGDVGLTLVAALPTIIGALLAALIAIAFFFILLAARQAGVILFVVISPLAIVCYILPNTQGIFKKWLKIFEALLLVYPICGLLMGVGGFASVVLLAAAGGGAWTSLVALLTSVVPFFFVPTVLKSSMAGLGNLGAKISGVGARLGQKSRKLGAMGSSAVKKSDKYQAASSLVNSNRSGKRLKKLEDRVKDREAKRRFKKGYDELSDARKKEVDQSYKDKISATNKMRMAKWAADVSKGQKAVADGEAMLAGAGGAAGFMAATAKAAQYEAEKSDEATRNWNKDYYSEDLGETYSYEKNGRDYRFRKNADGSIENLNTNKTASADEQEELQRQMNAGNVTVGKEKARFVKNKDGDWVSADGKTDKLYTQAEIDQKVADKQGTLTSYAEAKRIESEAGVQQDLGKYAGYAGLSEGEVLDIGHGKLTAAATETEIVNNQTVVNGQSNVLQVRRNEAQTAINQTIGKAQATQRLEDMGYSTVGSVQAAQNAAEAQLVNTISQNEAAPETIMQDGQIEQAVTTGTAKLINQDKIGKVEAEVYSQHINDLTPNKANIENAAMRRIFEEAAKNSINTNAPNRDAIFAAAENKQLEQGVNEATSLLINGSVRNANGDIVDATDPKKLGEYLKELGRNGGDETRVRAAVRKLKSLGGPGQSSFTEAINSGEIQDFGVMDAIISEIKNDAKFKPQDVAVFKAFSSASNIPSDSNHPDITDARNLFAKGKISEVRGKVENYVGSLKPTYIGAMSDDAFDAAFGKLRNGKLVDVSGNELTSSNINPSILEFAHDALENRSLLGDVKESSIEVLKKLDELYNQSKKS